MQGMAVAQLRHDRFERMRDTIELHIKLGDLEQARWMMDKLRAEEEKEDRRLARASSASSSGVPPTTSEEGDEEEELEVLSVSSSRGAVPSQVVVVARGTSPPKRQPDLDDSSSEGPVDSNVTPAPTTREMRIMDRIATDPNYHVMYDVENSAEKPPPVGKRPKLAPRTDCHLNRRSTYVYDDGESGEHHNGYELDRPYVYATGDPGRGDKMEVKDGAPVITGPYTGGTITGPFTGV
jgi:hypothetical protein